MWSRWGLQLHISELETWSWFRPCFLQISKGELEPTHTALLWEGREEVRIVCVKCPEHPFTSLCRGEPCPACGTHLMMSVGVGHRLAQGEVWLLISRTEASYTAKGLRVSRTDLSKNTMAGRVRVYKLQSLSVC